MAIVKTKTHTWISCCVRSIIIIALLVVYSSSTLARNRSDKEKLLWRKTSRLDVGRNFLAAVTEDEEYLYLLGDDEFREKNDKLPGILPERPKNLAKIPPPPGWIPKPGEKFSEEYVPNPGDNFLTRSNFVRFEKREKKTGALVKKFGKKGIVEIPFTSAAAAGIGFFSMDIDSTALYMLANEEDFWRVEKRDKTHGGLVKDFAENGILLIPHTSESHFATALKVDQQFFYIAVGSYDEDTSILEKRSKETGELMWAQGTHVFKPKFVVDKNFFYVFGSADFETISRGPVGDPLLLEKREKQTGELIWSQPFKAYYSDIHHLAADENSLYLMLIPSAHTFRGRIEKRSKQNGQLIWKALLNKTYIPQAIGITKGVLILAGDNAMGRAGGTTNDFSRAIEKRRKTDGGFISFIKIQPHVPPQRQHIVNRQNTTAFLLTDEDALYTGGNLIVEYNYFGQYLVTQTIDWLIEKTK